MKIFDTLSKIYIVGLTVVTCLIISLYAYTAFYARPTGDDLGYACDTRQTWISTHSIGEVLSKAIEVTKNVYNKEDASYVMTFLCTIIPEVFKPWTFWIAIWFILLLIVLGSDAISRHLCGRIIGLSNEAVSLLTMSFLFLFLQHMPSTGSGMYWYTGSVHYVMPFCMVLFSLTLMSLFLRNEIEKDSLSAGAQKKTRKMVLYIVGLSLAAVLIGGSGYFAALYMLMIYVASFILFTKRFGKKLLPLLIPFMITLLGFIVVLKSPGMNSFRAGGEMKLSLDLVIDTIWESIKRSVQYGKIWITECVFILPCMVMLCVILSNKFCWINSIKFSHPILFSGYTFLSYAAVYAPWVYSEYFDVQGASDGPKNYCFLTFLLSMMAIFVYIIGYFRKRYFDRNENSKSHFVLVLKYACLIIATVFLILQKGDVKKTHGYEGVIYLSSGQAEDYKAQCRENMEMLLDGNIRNVELVPTNSYQGLLCNMVATENPKDFTSHVYAAFYGKDSVIMKSE